MPYFPHLRMRSPLEAYDHFCPACHMRLRIWHDLCTRCQHRIIPSTTIRKQGAALLILGFLVCSFFAILAASLANIMLHSNDPGATSRYTGTRGDAIMIFVILGVVFLIGFTFLTGGAVQLAYGRKSESLTKAAIFWVGFIGLLFLLEQAWELIDAFL